MFLEHPSLVCISETHVLWSLILHRYAAVQRVSYRVLESQLEDGVMDGYSGHSPIERMMHLSWREARRVCFDDGVDGTPSKSFATRIFGVGVKYTSRPKPTFRCGQDYDPDRILGANLVHR